MDNGNFYNQDDLNKNVTLGILLEYTDEFLMPKMGEMMDEKIGKLRSDLIDHVEKTVKAVYELIT